MRPRAAACGAIAGPGFEVVDEIRDPRAPPPPACKGRFDMSSLGGLIERYERNRSRVKPVLVVAAAVLLALSAAAPVLAEGGEGASFCSESGVPAGYDGDFDPAPNNVGEYVAWIPRTSGTPARTTPETPRIPPADHPVRRGL